MVLQSCEIFGPKIEAVSPVLRTLCKAGAVIIDNTNVVTAKNHRKLNIPDGTLEANTSLSLEAYLDNGRTPKRDLQSR